jgi:hypothetical protein
MFRRPCLPAAGLSVPAASESRKHALVLIKNYKYYYIIFNRGFQLKKAFFFFMAFISCGYDVILYYDMQIWEGLSQPHLGSKPYALVSQAVQTKKYMVKC